MLKSYFDVRFCVKILFIEKLNLRSFGYAWTSEISQFSQATNLYHNCWDTQRRIWQPLKGFRVETELESLQLITQWVQSY